MKAPTADPPIELYDVSEEQNSGGKLTTRKNLKIVINVSICYFSYYIFLKCLYIFIILLRLNRSCFNNEVLCLQMEQQLNHLRVVHLF